MENIELSKKVKSIIENDTGLTISEIQQLDYDDELELIKSINGEYPKFSEEDIRVL